MASDVKQTTDETYPKINALKKMRLLIDAKQVSYNMKLNTTILDLSHSQL
jgi:hypothetical protein